MQSLRSSILLAVLALVLGVSALAGVLPVGPQHAVAADETGEETPTTPEEPPPVVETPTEPETTPEPETPVATPPSTTPPVGESGETPVETPKSTPSAGTEASGGGSVGGGGGSSSGSGGSAGGGAATTSPSTSPSRHASRTPTRATGGGGGGGNSGGNGGDRGSKSGNGTGSGSRNTGGGGDRTPSHSGGGSAPQPTFSPQGFDEGASAVTNVASHVGEAFAEALPTAPLKKIGDRLAAHIAGAGQARSGIDQQRAVDHIGAALGAALIGSAVAVDRAPAANNSPIPFFDPPGGKSGTIYLILIAALLLGVGALLFREVRSSLGFGTPRARAPVTTSKTPRVELRQSVGVALIAVRRAANRWSWRFRRLRSNAVAGLRSLF